MHNPLLAEGAQSFNPFTGQIQGFGQAQAASQMEPSTRTQQPIVTGTGVLGIKFKDGVMLAADTLGSYGSLARYRDCRRLHGCGEHTLIGASGDISDYQRIQALLTELRTLDEAHDDGCRMTPRDIHQYLGRVMYNRRNKFDPLWNELVVAGFRDGKPFLGCVDLIGTMYEDNVIATSFGYSLKPQTSNLQNQRPKSLQTPCAECQAPLPNFDGHETVTLTESWAPHLNPASALLCPHVMTIRMLHICCSNLDLRLST